MCLCVCEGAKHELIAIRERLLALTIQLCWEVGRIDQSRDNDKAWAKVIASHRHITAFQENVVHINQENRESPWNASSPDQTLVQQMYQAILSDQNSKIPGEPATIIKVASISPNRAQVS